MTDRLGVGAHSASSDDDVIDRQARLVAEPPDEVAAQPAGALAREGRDDDLVDPLVVGRLHRGGEGIGMDDLAVGVDPLGAQLRERAAQPPGSLGMGEVVGLRRHDQEARRPLRRARAHPVEQRLGDDRLVRDDEHVGLESRRVVVGDDVADRQAPGRARDLADDVAAQPARALGRVGRDDDLVRRRLELRERVLRRLQRCRVDDEPLRRHGGAPQKGERLVEPASGRGAARVLVDDVAVPRLADGGDHGHVDVVARRPLSKRVEQGR